MIYMLKEEVYRFSKGTTCTGTNHQLSEAQNEQQLYLKPSHDALEELPHPSPWKKIEFSISPPLCSDVQAVQRPPSQQAAEKVVAQVECYIHMISHNFTAYLNK